MAKLTTVNGNTTLIEQHRAVCDSKGNHWTGTWRDNLTQANQDAEKHRKNNKQHDVWLETKETTVVRTLFTG